MTRFPRLGREEYSPIPDPEALWGVASPGRLRVATPRRGPTVLGLTSAMTPAQGRAGECALRCHLGLCGCWRSLGWSPPSAAGATMPSRGAGQPPRSLACADSAARGSAVRPMGGLRGFTHAMEEGARRLALGTRCQRVRQADDPPRIRTRPPLTGLLDEGPGVVRWRVVWPGLQGLQGTSSRYPPSFTRWPDAALAAQPPDREPVGWLRGFRGIDTLSATILVAELVDCQRFTHPRELMAYLGLVPSEYSSGDRERRARPATPTRGACSSRPRGTSATARPGAGRSRPARTDNRPRVAPRPGARSSACIVATAISSDTANARPSR